MKKRFIIFNTIFVFIALLLLLFANSYIVSNINKQNTEEEIQNYLHVAEEIFDGTNATKTTSILHKADADLRITIIDLQGNVIADSSSVQEFESHLTRPEILKLGTISYRYSTTLGMKMMYLASYDDGYYLRVAIPQTTINATVKNLVIYGSIVLLVILALSLIFIFKSTKNMFKPLKNQINKLEKIVGKDSEYAGEDIEVLSNQIDEVNSLINTKIETIQNDKDKITFVLNSINQGLIVIGDAQKVIMINSFASNIFKFDEQEIIDKPYIYLIRDLGLRNQIEQAMNKMIFSSMDYKVDGKTYLFNFNSINYGWSSTGHKQNGVAILILDVTEARNIATMKREFFANASHELKSPLTSIIGYQQMIQQGIITDEKEIKDATSRTIKEATRMNKIIIDMLELSKLESNNKKAVEKVNIKNIIDESVEASNKGILDKKISLELLLEDFELLVNKEDAYNLIHNLVDNAIKYNVKGGSIKIVSNSKNKELSVEDTGIGIDKNNQNRIFERFYRVDQSKDKEIGGTGLGLSIVKHICSTYNYKIRVESELNKGSKFTIFFENNEDNKE